MKRLYLIYAAVIAALTLVGILWIALAVHDNNAPALRNLGKGEREFREARNELVLNTADAVPMLVKYATKVKNPIRGRVQALTILKEIALHQDLSSQARFIVPLLSEGNRGLALATLQAMGAFVSLDGAEKVAPFLADPDTVMANVAMRALTGSAKALQAGVSAAIRSGDRGVVDSLVGVARSYTLPKDRIYGMAGEYYGRIGDTVMSKQMQSAQGIVHEWMICGGFGISKWDDVDRVQEPETTSYDRNAVFRGMGGAVVSWRPFFAQGYWDTDIWRVLERKAPAVAIITCFITVPDDRTALLFANPTDAVTAFVNGKQVIRAVNPGGHPEIGEWARVQLEKGVNRILLRLGRQEVGEGWGLYVRITDARGEGMADAVISPEPGPVSKK